MAAKATPQWFQQKQIYDLFKNPEFKMITRWCNQWPRLFFHSPIFRTLSLSCRLVPSWSQDGCQTTKKRRKVAKELLLMLLSLVRKENCQLALRFRGREEEQTHQICWPTQTEFTSRKPGNASFGMGWGVNIGGRDLSGYNQRSVCGWGQKLVCSQG